MASARLEIRLDEEAKARVEKAKKALIEAAKLTK